MKLLDKKDGYKYTQSEDVPLEERMILSIICLANTANESDWKLITEAEADEIRRRQEESMNDNK